MFELVKQASQKAMSVPAYLHKFCVPLPIWSSCIINCMVSVFQFIHCFSAFVSFATHADLRGI